MSAKVLLRIALALGAALVVWGALALFRRSHQDDAGGLNLSRLNAKDVSEIALRKPGDTLVLATAGTRVDRERVPRQYLGRGSVSGDDRGYQPAERGGIAEQRVSPAARGGQCERQAAHRHGRRQDGARHVVWNPRAGLRGLLRSAGRERPRLSPAGSLRGADGRWVSLNGEKSRSRRLPRDSVSKVEVGRGKTRWSLQRKGAGWELSHGPADSTKVARFLGLLGGLRAAGFPEPAEMDSIHFEAPERSLTVLSGSGQTLAVAGVRLHPSGGVLGSIDGGRASVSAGRAYCGSG